MQRTLNLGVLAHVDAGKTSLTEQILYRAGVISAPGSVDKGTAQTDTLALERQRGISIKSAVTSFRIGDLTINLIDTPGHADFIAEVERVIGVLDAVILVVAAVEGVQPQTRRLSRAIANLGLPCLIVINKIDRAGARGDALLDEVAAELGRDLVPMSTVMHLGTRAASAALRDPCRQDDLDAIVEAAVRHDDELLWRWLDADGKVAPGDVMASLRRQVAEARVTPVVYGSAATGAGIDALFWAIAELLPGTVPVGGKPLAAEVFKIQRLPSGERLLLCRIWSGAIATRDVVPIVRPHEPGRIAPARITGIDGFRDGRVAQVPSASGGDIVRVHGLQDARIGDWLGEPLHDRVPAFEPPVFEAQIEAIDPRDHVRLNAALADLVDQDPLIGVRRDAHTGAIFVRLYGEVQQEVIAATLADDYGVAATFGTPSVVYVERVAGEGRAAEIFPDSNPPFYATVGFHIRPKSGERSAWAFTPGKAKQGFFDAAEEGGRSVLEQGIYGWPVIDWDVDVTDLIFLVGANPADYRRLATLVMADALREAGTVVCEPVHEVTVTAPPESLGAVLHALSARRGVVLEAVVEGGRSVVRGIIPAAEVDGLGRELPGMTNGRAEIETRFSDYRPIEGNPPVRPRTDLNPFDRTEFMSRLSGRF